MATKKTGISRDFIIHPGEYLADILDDRDISQAELATRTGVSEAFVSRVINGKKDISSKFAMALEYALGTPKTFWLNLQANYEAQLVEYSQSYTITEEEKEVKLALREVIAYLRRIGLIPSAEPLDELILSLRRVLQVTNLGSLKDLVPVGEFRISDKHLINKYVLGAWLRICQITNDNKKVNGSFDKRNIPDLVSKLRPVMFEKAENLDDRISSIMGDYGIRFSIVKNFKGAPVQGYIAKAKDESIRMAITIRGAYAGIFWFSLFHEIGHLYNDDLNKTTKFIDGISMEKNPKEDAADEFAREAMLNGTQYNAFLEKNDFSIEAIKEHCIQQGVPLFVVIERLQKERYIKYNMYSNYKPRFQWT